MTINIGWLLKAAPDLYAGLKQAAPEYCSNHCPSTFRTADGPPPHSEECQKMMAALEMAERDANGELTNLEPTK